MKMIKLFGLLLVLFTFVGCADDSVTPSCQNYAVNLGPFYLKESSANLFPYTKTDTNLVFKNALNEELVFTQSLLVRDTFMYSSFNECPFDSTLQVPYVRTEDKIIASYRNDSLDLWFQFSFEASFRRDKNSVTGESDMATAFVSRYSHNMFAILKSLISFKSGLPLYTLNKFYPSITLGQKSFENVYSNEFSNYILSDFLVYMNYDFGIVGFEEKDAGKVWVFDRIE